MKTLQPLLAALLLAGSTVYGGIIYSSGTLNTAIPDANPNGISSTINVSGLLNILDVNVTINLSDGYNGDLYAYLSYNGTLVSLLNRVGTGGSDHFGYVTAGFNNITLDDQATGNGSIHLVPSPISGSSYQPDGGSLASFNNISPNGNWTIFFADLASGGGSGPSVLGSWSLDITAVPEPANLALAIVGGVFLLVVVVRNRPVRSRLHCWWAAANAWIDAV